MAPGFEAARFEVVGPQVLLFGSINLCQTCMPLVAMRFKCMDQKFIVSNMCVFCVCWVVRCVSDGEGARLKVVDPKRDYVLSNGLKSFMHSTSCGHAFL